MVAELEVPIIRDGFLQHDPAIRDRRLGNGRPIVVAATTDIPATPAAPKINCMLLRGMIASIVTAIAVAYGLITPWHVISFTHAVGARWPHPASGVDGVESRLVAALCSATQFHRIAINGHTTAVAARRSLPVN